MEKQFRQITKPEELLAWLEENDLLMEMDLEDANILLGYLEGHDYGIGIDRNGAFSRMDLNVPDGEWEAYTIDDLIDAVCEWNYSLIQETNIARQNPENFTDFVEKQNKYEQLRKDEKRLDRMFSKTIYGKKINQMAEKLADEVVRNLRGRNKEEAIPALCNEITEYESKGKGR